MSILTNSQLEIISSILWCTPEDIKVIKTDAGGMTNNNSIISVHDKKYFVRIPGKGSNELVDRRQEYNAYLYLHQVGLDTHTIFVGQDGLKITHYIENVRPANPKSTNDVRHCMNALRKIHEFNANCKIMPNVKYFSLTANIDKYRELAHIHAKLPREDYEEVYNNCLQVASWIESLNRECCLCHIDVNPDNMLFQGCSTDPMLIDWEYAGLQDPHLDIAMWAVYCNYDINDIDKLLNMYFQKKIDMETRYKIYGYCALAGLLWYNWCVYKQQLGINFGDYTTNQFMFAKKYSNIVLNRLKSDKHLDNKH